jgi:hypothetical protein
MLPAAWADLPDGPASRDLPVGKCLYGSPARGLPARVAEFDLWCRAYGHFGSGIRAHAWHPSSVHFHGRTSEDVAAYQLGRHEVVDLDCDLRRGWQHREQKFAPVPPCGHDADAEANKAAGLWRGLMHRGACRKTGCDWEGPVRGSEKQAVEDGMDHAWPGWRNLPPVPRVPDNAWEAKRSKPAAKALDGWLTKVVPAYPDGWVEAGGPIRTVREKNGTRHIEARTPFGGWDLALTCHLCGRAEGLTWLTGGGVTVAGCEGGCPEPAP